MSVRSAGIVAYRYNNGVLEVMLVHPGGPFWAKKDDGAWSVPKGLYEEGEQARDAARREFEEETGFKPAPGEYIDLGELRQPSGKIIHAWAMEADYDVEQLDSNTFPLEWPRGSGTTREYPEVDRAGWFTVEAAQKKILKGQRAFLDRLRRALAAGG